MKFKIVWSDFAETQLDQIFSYYKRKASPTIAKKLIRKIIIKPNKLIRKPFIGQQEELLRNRQIQYRYLVFKNYKLIYSVD